MNAGTKLGPYEILARIGAGGMGEVWRARDTRLERTVAIKVLPAHLSSDLPLNQRFEREARAISSLSHPHICTLYDVGHQNGIDYLVMEYLEGQTLAERLRKGAVPLEEALRCAIQIAEALDKAHRQGIVHRDLKPGNIMLTKAGVKLLDFGLAKFSSVAAEVTRLTSSQSQIGNRKSEIESEPPYVGCYGAKEGLSGEVTQKESELTKEGTILGTLSYMAPEQLEGKQADTRTDIFAFGVVLYEMVSGKKAFTGKSQASLIAAILEREPEPLSKLQPLSPPAFERVVKRCLAKEPDARWQTALDLVEELKWIAEGESQAGMPAVAAAVRTRRELVAWSAVLVSLVATLGLAVAYFNRPPAERQFASVVSPGNSPVHSIALSPDGRQLALAARDASGTNRLWIRRFDSPAPQSLAGTEGASFPFWSPDSRSIGFFASGQLRKVESSGGPVLPLCTVPVARNFRFNGTWSREGVIVFSTISGELQRVSADGGRSSALPNTGAHQWPHFLPDGRHFLSVARNLGGDDLEPGVYLWSLDSTNSRLLLPGRSQGNVSYAQGHLLFLSQEKFMAQRFDLDRLELKGEAFPVNIGDKIQQVVGLPHWGIFSASQNGVLAYQPGQEAAGPQLVWFDRQGKQGAAVGEPTFYNYCSLSPDGTMVASVIDDWRSEMRDIWISPSLRGAWDRLTFDLHNERGVIWSPDGSSFVFGSNRKGRFDLYRKDIRTGSEQPLLTNQWDKIPRSWSSDGRFVLYDDRERGLRYDIWVLPMRENREPFPFLATPLREDQAQFSPNVRWVAYHSNDSGIEEVYVRPFPPEPGRAQRISTGGGSEPRWRQDGKEIFYLAPDRTLMVAEVDGTGETFKVNPARPLFQTRATGPGTPSYDVTADGQRFLINTMMESTNTAPITVVQNWTADGKKK